MSKISTRFYNDQEVRAIWNDEKSEWFFSVLDVVGVLNNQTDYEKNRNYWKYLKAKLKKEGSQVVSVTTQLKLVVPDGKRYNTDVIFKRQKREIYLHSSKNNCNFAEKLKHNSPMK